MAEAIGTVGVRYTANSSREDCHFRTNRIVANLEAIDENDKDLEALLEQTNIIAANLKYIEESDVSGLEPYLGKNGKTRVRN